MPTNSRPATGELQQRTHLELPMIRRSSMMQKKKTKRGIPRNDELLDVACSMLLPQPSPSAWCEQCCPECLPCAIGKAKILQILSRIHEANDLPGVFAFDCNHRWDHVTTSMTREVRSGASAEMIEWMDDDVTLQCNGVFRGALLRTSWHQSTRPRVTTAATPGAKNFFADALRSTVMSQLAQLLARVGTRRHVCKNGWRAALLFITVAPDKNRIASITNMLKVTELGQRLCSSSTCTVHVEGHQLDTIIFCVRALNQTPRNCDGSHDAKASSQNRRGSSRSQPLRNGICICRRCREGLHTEGSHKK